ncbi:helix-turn-helix domain-containing protein [Enterococcus sp. HY326]|uniref:helix-turn-helix domain-containing protein n=1 Tax=Enterococcus sp. HY326 TaxID=2971265 RepID=UPI0022400D91|nr:helix-turn-helix domain-containing protein [Enterococcus sp. HY326]
MDILSTLDTNSQGLLKLLKFFEVVDGQALKKDICDALNISPKKLRYQIENMQKNYQEDLICDNLMHEVRITYRENSSYLVIKNRTFQQSIPHKLMMEMLMKPALTYEQLEQTFFLSTSSISRYLSRLRLLLSNYGLELKKTKIIGSEQQIRFFYLHYIEEVYSLSAKVFQEIPEVENMIESLIFHIENYDNVTLAQYNQLRIRRLLYIFYYRSFFCTSNKTSKNDFFKISYPKDTPYLRDSFLQKDSAFPESLLAETEFDMLMQFFFGLPLVSYEGWLYNRFLIQQRQQQTVFYQVYKYSRKILSPAFTTISNAILKKRLELMLFCINNNGLLFNMDKDLSNQIVINAAKLNPDLHVAGDRFLKQAILKINQFVTNMGLAPFNLSYLLDQYGLLLIRSGMYEENKIHIGIFLGKYLFNAQTGFEYLETRLQTHPLFAFHDLLIEEVACDYLITNDLTYAHEKRDLFKDCKIINFFNPIADSEELSMWLFEKNIEHNNKKYE